MEQLNPGLESIDFQDGQFFRRLTAIFEPLAGHRKVPSNKELAGAAGDIERVIREFTKTKENDSGLNVTLIFEYHPTMVMFNGIDPSSVLQRREGEDSNSAGGLELIRKARDKVTVDLDLKTGRVQGDMAKTPAFIVIDLNHFVADRYTAEEFAAVTLHEIGHLFTMYEFLDRTVQTNQVLAGLDKALRGSDGVKNRKIIIEEAGKKLKFDRTVIDSALDAKGDSSVTTIFISENFKMMRSENGDSFYDTNSWEMLADQYAARHGAGRAIVTAMHKFYRRAGETTGRTAVVYYIMEILKMASVALTAVGVVGFTILGVSTGNIATLLTGIALLPLLFGIVIDDDPGIYDKPLDRALRMRHQLIQFSRQVGNDKRLVTQITQDVELIDETTKNYNNRKTWFDAIAGFISKNSRRKQEVIKFQKELEALASNDLFLKSAQLGALGAS